MKKTIVRMNPLVSKQTMRVMRERLGRRPNDISADEDILSMSPYDFLDNVLAWEGIFGYTSYIISLINEAYGIDLDCIRGEFKREIEEE